MKYKSTAKEQVMIKKYIQLESEIVFGNRTGFWPANKISIKRRADEERHDDITGETAVLRPEKKECFRKV